MNKFLRRAFFIFVIPIAVLIVLNTPVMTRQGIDYKVKEMRIPLYLKALDFIDRYYNYGILADRITAGKKSDFEKAVGLLKWTKENLKENPGSLPVVDDHAWHIIIRGYGTDDQFQDVFTTLCNRAGMGAFFSRIDLLGRSRARSLSFVRLSRGWTVFDAYRGIYFLNADGKPVILKEIQSGDWKAIKVSAFSGEEDYSDFFRLIGSIDFGSWKDSRAAIQSPVRRLIHRLKGDRRQPEGNGYDGQK